MCVCVCVSFDKYYDSRVLEISDRDSWNYVSLLSTLDVPKDISLDIELWRDKVHIEEEPRFYSLVGRTRWIYARFLQNVRK